MNETATSRRITDLATRIAHRFGTMDPTSQRLSLAIYGALASGPVSRSALADRTGLTLKLVTRTIEEWPGVVQNESGEITGYWGLTVDRMAHRLQVGDATLYTWCAFDTLFIPELLGAAATVESADPISGRTLTIEVSADGARVDDAEDVWVSFVDPEALDQDAIRSSFCHHIYFFESRANAEQHAAGKPSVMLLSLADAVQLASLTNHARYGDALGVSP